MKKNRVFMILFIAIFLLIIAIIISCLKNMIYKIKASISFDSEGMYILTPLNVGDTADIVFKQDNNNYCSTYKISDYEDKNLSTNDRVCKVYRIAVMGDVAPDGKITGSDISRAYSAYKQATTLKEEEFMAADITGDNKLTGSDISAAYNLYKHPYYEKLNGNIYDVTLDYGTPKVIYEKYGDGYYLNSTMINEDGTIIVSDKMTTSSNGIIVPTKEGYIFEGYYTSGGVQYIDKNGMITENAKNTRFKENGTLTAKWTEIPATSISLDKTSYAVTTTDKQVQLTATVSPTNATDKTVTWTSSNPSFATVDQTGKVTIVRADGKGTNSAVITAKTSNGLTNTCTFTLKDNAINVLFIGNSKTFQNRMPKLVESMATKAGKKVNVFMITIGSRKLINHTKETLTSAEDKHYTIITRNAIINQVKATRYDYVVVQEQTTTGEVESDTKAGIDAIIALLNISGSKSYDAKVMNNVIWRALKSNSTWYGLGNTSAPIYKEQTNADNAATNIAKTEKNQTVILTGRQLFDYEYQVRKLCLDLSSSYCKQENITKINYHLYRTDGNHAMPGGSYLEAGLIYSAIYGYPSLNTSIIITDGWDCEDNACANSCTTNDWNKCSGDHVITASAQQQLWNYMLNNKKYIYEY